MTRRAERSLEVTFKTAAWLNKGGPRPRPILISDPLRPAAGFFQRFARFEKALEAGEDAGHPLEMAPMSFESGLSISWMTVSLTDSPIASSS